MKHRYASDLHTHSNCSPDGKEPISAMLKRAEALGLYAYALTDHCECQKYETRYRLRVQKSWEEMEKADSHKLRFFRGVELGQPTQDLHAASEALAGREYDFVIGSLHNVRGFEDFYWLDYTKEGEEFIHNVLHAYWRELLEMIEWGNFDTLGHLTYPLRYIEGEHGIPVDLTEHREEIDEVFRALIRADRALEVNTSGLRQKIGRTLPDLPLLRRYRELGGALVTLGSDAHRTADLGKGIDDGMEILKQAGFREFAVYEKRRPILLPLE